jgi:uncharacterized paraquat-inducible protein A
MVPGVGSALIQVCAQGVRAALGDRWTTHLLLALLVLVFSLVLPLITLGLAGWVLRASHLHWPDIRLLQWVGTWSMADVFVGPC